MTDKNKYRNCNIGDLDEKKYHTTCNGCPDKSPCYIKHKLKEAKKRL